MERRNLRARFAGAKINTLCPCGRVNHVKSTSMGKQLKRKAPLRLMLTPIINFKQSARKCFNDRLRASSAACRRRRGRFDFIYEVN